MWLPSLVAFACFAIDSANGFLVEIRRGCLTSAATRMGAKLTAAAYAEDPSSLAPLPSDEAVFILSMISDDDARRNAVKTYLLRGLAGEQMLLPPGTFWERRRSHFVQETEDSLATISAAVQEEAWEKYIRTGGRRLEFRPPQLWACVDMTVQFARVFTDFESEYENEMQNAFR